MNPCLGDAKLQVDADIQLAVRENGLELQKGV